MQVLLRAAFHLSTLRGSDTARVAVVVDSDTAIRADTVATLLHPWRPWLDITDVLVVDEPPEDSWLNIAVANGVQAVAIVSERSEFALPLEATINQHRLRVLRSDYPTDSDLTAAFFHEMEHHHYELGGLNEWNGSPVLHSRHILKHISAANCIAHFPQYMIDELRIRRITLGRPLEALDIGCGPISRLRWGALEGLLHVTGIDPLLDIYSLLRAHHGLDRLPYIAVDRAIISGAETLDQQVAAGSFDFAYCCNALDHVKDPPAVVAQVARSLRSGARFALEFATREGSRQNWQQLHQFDLFLEEDNGELMCQWRDGRLDPLIPRDVAFAVHRVVVATSDHTTVILEHI